MLFFRSAFLVSAWLSCTRALAPRSGAALLRAVSRRDALLGLVSTVAAPAWAFDNAIPESAKYAERKKRRGDPPKEIGVGPRTVLGEDDDEVSVVGLKPCDGKPHCFSTTGDLEVEQRLRRGVDSLIAPWKPPADETRPLEAVAAALAKYEPGQGGVDGGGFKVVEASAKYVYAQFESLKTGFYDDVEFAAGAGAQAGLVLVRSSSRVGFTDFGVNAARLNYLAARLREQGWTIAEITSKGYPDYFTTAEDAQQAVKGDSVKSSTAFTRDRG